MARAWTAAEAWPGGGMRFVNAPHPGILLVDDSPEELAALEASLAPLGQRLVRAHSGQEALKKILVEDFACILLAARMPGLDGRETALSSSHELPRREHLRTDVPRRS